MTDLLGPANAANSVTTRPAETRVFGSVDTYGQDCSSPTALNGTVISWMFLNGIVQQIRNLIRGRGITVDESGDSNTDLMMLQAVQSVGVPFAVDTGVAGAMIADVNTPGFALNAGVSIRVQAAANVPGPTTIEIKNAGVVIGTYNVTRANIGALNPYDIIQGQVKALIFDGTEFQIETTSGGTGDLKWALAGTSMTGWVPLNGETIGDAASGASLHAGAESAPLFTFIWNNFSNTLCAVSSGRGANAAADFAANKTIAVPDIQGRSLVGIDAFAGASATGRLTGGLISTGTATTPGSSGGEAAHSLAVTEMPAHTHTVALGETATISASAGAGETVTSGPTTSGSTGGAGSTSSGGAGAAVVAHNTLPPFLTAVCFARL
jgi:hypothetical protein